jgi:CheY-like chemotaxis protein
MEVNLQSSGTSILLVEDDELLRELLCDALRSEGYVVLAAETPTDAIELLQGYPGEVDLLLTDVMMPEMLGTALAKKARAIRPQVPVLYISGYVDQPTVAELRRGSAFLQKPFSTEQLVATIQRVLSGSDATA